MPARGLHRAGGGKRSSHCLGQKTAYPLPAAGRRRLLLLDLPSSCLVAEPERSGRDGHNPSRGKQHSVAHAECLRGSGLEVTGPQQGSGEPTGCGRGGSLIRAPLPKPHPVISHRLAEAAQAPKTTPPEAEGLVARVRLPRQSGRAGLDSTSQPRPLRAQRRRCSELGPRLKLHRIYGHRLYGLHRHRQSLLGTGSGQHGHNPSGRNKQGVADAEGLGCISIERP